MFSYYNYVNIIHVGLIKESNNTVYRHNQCLKIRQYDLYSTDYDWEMVFSIHLFLVLSSKFIFIASTAKLEALNHGYHNVKLYEELKNESKSLFHYLRKLYKT